MPSELNRQVQRLLEAKVPEPEIIKFIKEFEELPAKQESSDQPYRIAAQGAGGALGGMAMTPTGNPLLIATGIGLGESMGGQAYDLGEHYLRWFAENRPEPKKTKIVGKGFDAYIADKKQEGLNLQDQSVKAVTDFALGATMPEAINRTVRGIGAVGRGLMGPIKRGIASQAQPLASNYDDIMRATEKMGMKPTAGMVSDNPAIQSLQQSLRQTPGGASVMYRVEQGNVEAAEKFAVDTAEKYGTIRLPEVMGGEIKESVKTAQSKFWERSGRLFDDVATYLPENERVDVTSTMKFFTENTPESPLEKRILGNLNAVRKDFYKSLDDNGQLDVRTLRRIKSRLGKVFDKAGPGDISTYDQKQLVFAMGDDLASAAAAKGGDAAAAAKRANLYYRLAKGNKKRGIPGHLNVIDTILQKSEEGSVYGWITGELNKGTSRIQSVFNQLPADVKGDVRATVLYQAGLATKGRQGALGDRFSFQTFLTNWNKMSSKAKSFLWGGNAYKEYEKDIMDIAMVSDFMQDLQAKTNYSNTAQVNMWHALRDAAIAPIATGAAIGSYGKGVLGGLAGAVGGAVAGMGRVALTVGVQHRQATLLTDPRFIKWLAEAARKSVRGTNFLPAHMVKLAILAQVQPELTESIGGFVQNLQMPEETSKQIYGVPEVIPKTKPAKKEDPNLIEAKKAIKAGKNKDEIIKRLLKNGYKQEVLDRHGIW